MESPHRQLWAPWRISYIDGTDQPPTDRDEPRQWLDGADSECFICRAIASRRDRENLVVDRGEQVATLLNRYPYNNGHLLVAPLRHKGRLDQLTDQEQLEIGGVICRFVDLLEQTLHAQGFNVGLNLGRAAGAGLPGHLHWHIVPRWQGDTNFMPVLDAVRVIPQSLDALWQVLSERAGECGSGGDAMQSET